MRNTIVALVVLCAATLSADSPKCPVNYGYSGFANPDQWKNIEGSSLCGSGQTQSPIRIQNTQPTTSARLQFEYQRSALKIENSGHDFRGTIPSDVNDLLIVPGDSRSNAYRLDNFHFHTLSEHYLGNQRFAGEVHLVHKRGVAPNEEIAVVTFFVTVVSNGTNNSLNPFIEKLPLDLCKDTSIEFDPNVLLSTIGTQYYTYTGSLTTPGCDQGVRFFIYPRPIIISQNQYNKLKAFGPNARGLQRDRNPQPLVNRVTTPSAKK